MLLGKFICWLAVLNRLTIEVRQVHLGRSLDPTCMFCNAHPKDVGHIFCTCQFTKYIWNAFSRNEAFTDRLVIGCASSNGKRRNLEKTVLSICRTSQDFFFCICLNCLEGNK